MDRWDTAPDPKLYLLDVALALLCAAAGVAAASIVMHFTGELVTAILVLPVVAAAWFGGAVAGALTIVLETASAAFILPPFGSFVIGERDEALRLYLSVGVALVALLATVRARRIERRFRALVTVASEGIWTIDADGRTTYVNPRMAEMLGYTPVEMRGRRFSEFMRDEYVQTAESGFADLRRGLTGRAECELRRQDGSWLWIHYGATPLSSGGRFVGALGVVADISERKRAEETIQEQADALERANREREDFLAMLGHELRNIAGPLMTAAKLMALKSEGTLHRERNVILRQAEHLGRLVDDISDVSRFMRGKLRIRSERVNVCQIVREACDVVSPLAVRAQHTIEVDVPEDLTVEGDTVRLRQVVVNLLTNAVKYTPSGGRIRVSAGADADHAVIRVRDNGMGLSPDFLPKLFEPFAQQPQTLDRAEGGLGLGLAIVNGIVRAHGGTIEAHSDGVGKGSEFVVTLPMAAAAPAVLA